MFKLGSPAPNKFHVWIGIALLILLLKFINDYYAENQNYMWKLSFFLLKEILK